MTKVPSKCISSYQLHTVQYTTHYTCTHKVRAYACSLTNQNHQPTPCQLHTRLGGYGNSLERQRHSLMQHVLMLIITITRLTHEMALVLFLQRRETITMINLLHNQSWEHSLPQGHPPHTTSKLPLQTNSVLSIVMSTSSKRH